MANKSLLLKNIKDLSNKMNGSINWVDIDYDVKRPYNNAGHTRTRSLICRNDYAILNGYRLWLQSKRYDYIRNPNFGGLFQNNFNDRCTFGPENEGIVRDIILQETADKWKDINIIACEVKAIMQNREWHIRIIAQDKNSKLILADDNLFIEGDDEVRMTADYYEALSDTYEKRPPPNIINH